MKLNELGIALLIVVIAMFGGDKPDIYVPGGPVAVPTPDLNRTGVHIPFDGYNTIGPTSLFGMCNIPSDNFLTESVLKQDTTQYRDLEWSGGTEPILLPNVDVEWEKISYTGYSAIKGIWLEYEVTSARIWLDPQGRVFAILGLPQGTEQYVQLYRGPCARYLRQSANDALNYQLQDGKGPVRIERFNLAFTLEGQLVDAGYWAIPFLP